MSERDELINLIAETFDVIDICERKLATINQKLMVVCNEHSLHALNFGMRNLDRKPKAGVE